MMFSENNINTHIGTEIKFRDSLYDLQPLEDYFIAKCLEEGIEYSHDCTAHENTYFKTLNYTTYAGMFIMHPLQFDLQLFQMYDAKADNLESVGHLDFIESRIKAGTPGKYTLGNGEEMPSRRKKYKGVMVLPGSNKFYDTVHQFKFELICKKLGKDLVIKPHPITEEKILKEVKQFKGKAAMAEPLDNLYSLIENTDKVYTTHISETALTSLIMGKKIEPLEAGPGRFEGSFSHINHFCFSELDPLKTVGSIFASPKSGIVHPAVDKNWQKKIDDYFSYILAQRNKQKGYYV
jgi:hypothetical protein